MSTSQFSTLFGQGANTLAQALVPNASRQLIGLKAQNLGTRNLANSLLAQQRQFDLAQDQAKAKRLDEEIARRTQGSQITDGMNPDQIAQAKQMAQSIQAYGLNPSNPKLQIDADNQLLKNADYWNSMNRMRTANPMVQLPDIMGQDGKMVRQNPLSAVDLMATDQPYSGVASGSTAPFVASKNIAQTKGYTQDNQAVKYLQESLKRQYPNGIPSKDINGKISFVPTNAITSPSQLADLNIDQATIQKIAQQIATSQSTQNINVNTLDEAQKLFPNKELKGQYDRKKAFYDFRGAKYKSEKSKIDMWLAKKTKNLKLTQEEAKADKLKAEAILKKFESEGKMTNFQFLGDGQAVGFKQNAKTGESEVVSIDMKGTPKIVKDWKKVKQVRDGKEVEVLVSPSLKQQIVMKQSENGENTFGVEAYKKEGKLIVGNTFNKSMDMTDKTKNDLRTTINMAKSMIDVLTRHPEVAGGQGMWERFKELPKSAKGKTDIPATNFQTAIRFLNFNATPLLLAEKRFTDQDRKIVREAIGGQNLLDLAGKTKGGMQYLVSLLEARLNDTPIQVEDIQSIIMGQGNPGIIKQAQANLQQRMFPNVGQMAINPKASAIFQSNPLIQSAMKQFGQKLRFNPQKGAFFFVENGKPKYLVKNGKPLMITDKDQLKTLKEINE